MADTSEGRRVLIKARGNVTISGWAHPQIHVRNHERQTEVSEQSDGTHLNSSGNCDVEVPRHAQVFVLRCDGNLDADGLSHIEARGVSGNAKLEDVNTFRILGVGGNLNAVDSVLLAGDGSLGIGGNGHFKITQQSGHPLQVSAGGHLRVDASGLTSALIDARSASGRKHIHLGAAEALITLTCGGKLEMRMPDGARSSDATAHAHGETDWGADVGKILGDLGDRLGSEFGDAIQIKVQRALERAARSTAKAEARASRAAGKSVRWSFGWGDGTGQPPAPPAAPQPPAPTREPVSDDERLTILRMLQDKKISSEQAEALLAALEK